MQEKLEKALEEFLEREGFFVRHMEIQRGQSDTVENNLINLIGAIKIRAQKK